MTIKHFIIIILVLISQTGEAQTFHAQIEAGGNFSQIAGDNDAGYHKVGISGGLSVSVRPKKRWEYSLGILYAQKGSKSGSRSSRIFDLSINYVDIPLMVSFLDYAEDDYWRIKWQGGVVIGSLIGAESINFPDEDRIDLFNKTDIAFKVGATVFFTKHIGFALHYQRSLNRLYRSSKHPDVGGSDLQYHMFQAQLIYSIR